MHEHIEGTLTGDDVKRHVLHTFEVPAGAHQLTVRLRFEPWEVNGLRNMLCLSLFDPTGFRGAGHRGGAEHEIHITEWEATPGYRPGALPPGQWTVEIDTHRIVPGTPCRYRLDITVENTSAPQSEAAPRDQHPRVTPERGPGWYRGDLHAHSIHSDGRWDVVGLVTAARAFGLDFVTLTDHNTITGIEEMEQASSPDLLTLVGMELTTFWGHALSLGTRHWIDWRVQLNGRAMADIVREVTDAGGLFIIAHPGIPGDPICTGCTWQYTDVMPGPARVVEVWNGPWIDHGGNEQSLMLWYEWLNQGHRLAATSGTDAHGPVEGEGMGDLIRYVGFNVVYADELSEEAILAAVARGHLYLSAGPRLGLEGRTPAGEHAMMGDVLHGPEAEITADWADCPANARMRLIANGEAMAEWEPGPEGRRQWRLSSAEVRWCLIELRDEHGQMLALTNPIFLEAS